MQSLKITATFLDEVSSDIPSQNWGYDEWDKDFAAMKAIGIDTVIQIRSGRREFISYPSEVLKEKLNFIIESEIDLPDMFLSLAEKYSMKYYWGLYRYTGQYDWQGLNAAWGKAEVPIECELMAEAWKRYGHRKAFHGWYFSKEISTAGAEDVENFQIIGRFCKELSGGQPIIMSPGMLGAKSGRNAGRPLDMENHRQLWENAFPKIAGIVDICAFQDGHVDYSQLTEVLKLNQELADKHGIELWTNVETFDRDMPFRFPPIKWDKMRFKLQAAEAAGIQKACTFEFSHFMSPNSFWLQAGNLYNRYCEHFNLKPGE